MYGQRIARLGALDIKRSGLRVDEGVFAHLGEEILFGADPPAETVLRVQVEDFTRLDSGYRIDAAEGPGILLLRRNDPLDLDGLDHFPFLAEARLAASTERALARAARRRSSASGSVIRRRIRPRPAIRRTDAAATRRLDRPIPDPTFWTDCVIVSRTLCNSLFSRASFRFSVTSALT